MNRPAFSGYPPIGSVAVTPSDTQNIAAPGAVTSLYISNGGTISLVYWDGSVESRSNVPNGFTIVGHILRVNNTGTSCTGISAQYV